MLIFNLSILVTFNRLCCRCIVLYKKTHIFLDWRKARYVASTLLSLYAWIKIKIHLFIYTLGQRTPLCANILILLTTSSDTISNYKYQNTQGEGKKFKFVRCTFAKLIYSCGINNSYILVEQLRLWISSSSNRCNSLIGSDDSLLTMVWAMLVISLVFFLVISCWVFWVVALNFCFVT